MSFLRVWEDARQVIHTRGVGRSELYRIIQEVFGVAAHLITLAHLAPLRPLSGVESTTALLAYTGVVLTRVWTKRALFLLFHSRLTLACLRPLLFLEKPGLAALVHRLVEDFRILQAPLGRF